MKKRFEEIREELNKIEKTIASLEEKGKANDVLIAGRTNTFLAELEESINLNLYMLAIYKKSQCDNLNSKELDTQVLEEISEVDEFIRKIKSKKGSTFSGEDYEKLRKVYENKANMLTEENMKMSFKSLCDEFCSRLSDLKQRGNRIFRKLMGWKK